MVAKGSEHKAINKPICIDRSRTLTNLWLKALNREFPMDKVSVCVFIIIIFTIFIEITVFECKNSLDPDKTPRSWFTLFASLLLDAESFCFSLTDSTCK